MIPLSRIAASTVVWAAALMFVPVASATGVSSEAQALIEQNRAAEALQALDAHLKKNPQDAEARFTRGLALVRLDRSSDAIRVFAELTRDYPQLPEPYNNLAVLYAAQGDYEKAREALEAALATHPSYATAHENLGDIYAALAGAAYNRALLLDESNQVLRRKLALVNQLDRGASGGEPATLAAMPAATMPMAAPAPQPSTTLAAPAAPGPTVPGLDAETSAVLQQAVNSWAAAWSNQDLNAYFAAYAPEFVPDGGLSRSAWETQRRDRISRPKRIRVSVLDPQFTATGPDTATVSFRQEYDSDTFTDTVSKVLELKRMTGGWKIVREYAR